MLMTNNTASAGKSASSLLLPETLWAQRTDLLFLTLNVPDLCADDSLVCTLTKDQLSFQGTTVSGVTYHVELPFYAAVVEGAQPHVTGRSVSWVLEKEEKGKPYWPRLCKTPGKASHIKTDFSKWKDEDEQDEEVETAATDMGGANPFASMAGMPGMSGMDWSQMANMSGAAGMSGDMEGDFDSPPDSDDEVEQEGDQAPPVEPVSDA